jgi:YidC/Oxa1 family membrane protein insertase
LSLSRKNKKIFLVVLLLISIVILAGCSPSMGTTDTAALKEGNIFKHYLVYPLSISLNKIAEFLWGQYGLSILVVTICIRFLVLPLTLKQYKSSRAMQALQPEMKKLKEKYKDDAKKQQEETMKLFQTNGVNPLAGCFPLLVQMPLLIALYYSIIWNPAIREHTFLWVQLGEKDPFYILPILAAITTFIQQKIMAKYTPMTKQMQSIMMVFPILIFVMSMNFPAAMPLYWIYGNIFTIVQTHFIYGGSQKGGLVSK